jgi:hypothetical protein
MAVDDKMPLGPQLAAICRILSGYLTTSWSRHACTIKCSPFPTSPSQTSMVTCPSTSAMVTISIVPGLATTNSRPVGDAGFERHAPMLHYRATPAE